MCAPVRIGLSSGCRRPAAVALVWLGVVLAAALALAGPAAALTVGSGRDRARITRDSYGVPHIFGVTQTGMWFGAGWAQAQDRLVQMELVRRNAEGTLSAVFGSSQLSSDESTRQQYYTPAEYAAQYQSMPRALRIAVAAFCNGINAYVRQAYATLAARDREVPFEFWFAGTLLKLSGPYRPPPWRPTDVLAIGANLARSFGGGGGRELDNLAYLRYLQSKFPPQAMAIFNDTRWINDPTAPTTVPAGPANLSRTPLGRAAAVSSGADGSLAAAARVLRWLPTSSVRSAAATLTAMRARKREVGERFKVPWKDGSNAFIVAPWRSADGHALLWGAPQEGFGSPSIDVEAYLRAPGYDAAGMQIAGEPFILIGQNRSIAFTTTSEELVNSQIYAERARFSGQTPVSYLYKGRWRIYKVIHERIGVSGSRPVDFPVYRSVHGPAFKLDPADGVVYTTRYASWMREQGSFAGFAEQGTDRTLAQYRASIAKVATLHNFFYADRKGNIAYFGAGLVPILPRCGACDPRLPHNGDGSQEWRGFVAFRDMPHSINPAQGYLVNWNTKPDAQHYYQQNGGDEYWGRIYRSDRIAQLIRSHGRHMTFADVLAVERDIGTIDDNSYRPTASYFLPYLFRAYARLRAGHDPLVDTLAHPSLAAAIATLKRWDGHRTHGQPAMTIYVQFVAALTRNLFSGGVNAGERYIGSVNLADKSVDGSDYSSNATYNLIWHILGRTTGLVPCGTLCFKGDYFGGHRDQILVEGLDDALAILAGTGRQLDNGDKRGFGTPDVRRWGWVPHRDINWDSLDPIAAIGGVQTHFGSSPSEDRSTYMQGLDLGGARIVGVNVLPPGQSGFIAKTKRPDLHFGDQIGLFDAFRYKPFTIR